MKTRVGVVLAFTAAVISGFAVYANSYGVRAFGNATAYTTAKNLVAAVVLLAALVVARTAATSEGFTRPRTAPGSACCAAAAPTRRSASLTTAGSAGARSSPPTPSWCSSARLPGTGEGLAAARPRRARWPLGSSPACNQATG
jgi:hypothetical protein